MTRLNVSETQVLRILVSLLVSMITYTLVISEFLDSQFIFWIITLSFILLTLFEIRSSRHPFFSLPPAYYSLTMAFYIFLSGIIYFVLDEQSTTQFFVRDKYVILSAWYTLVSIQILWIGFYIFPDKSFRFTSKSFK